MNLQKIDLKNILFLDIETVPISATYQELPDKLRQLWDKKASHLINSELETSETIFNRAGIYAEFGKIICISVGFIYVENEKKIVRTKSFASDNEKQLLFEFNELINKHYNTSDHLLCAHNGKEFDFPYIARRLLINGMHIPNILDNAGKKPWQIQHLDTMELWKFGDYKHFTSLDLLAAIFDIPSPKDDIDGSMVAEVYYKEKDLQRIVTYCEKDVKTLINVLMKYRGEAIIK